MEPFDIPVHRTYKCPCGLEGKMHETMTHHYEDGTYSIETTLQFEHPQPISTRCVDLISAFKEEQRLLLQMQLNGSLERLRRSLDLHGL